MSNAHPDRETLCSALALAVRAPSVHNSQPWLWRIGDGTVHLYADTGRHLPHTDPDQRDLVLSCGAALHHLRVAARGLGWETVVHRLPNPADPDHLAAVEFHSSTPTPDAVRAVRAITRRRTDRRRYTSWEVPEAYLAAITAAGAANGVLVYDVDAGAARVQLLRAFERAAWDHARDFSYGAELAQWSGRHASAEGVPARSAVSADVATVRPFSNPGLPQAVYRDAAAADRMLLLSTSGDDRISRLRAGEATSAVLLTATALGLASCPLTEPLEVPDVRRRIRTDILGDSGFPQLIVRIGWAATSSDEVPRTPRRPVDDVVLRPEQ
ncbi:Acg family FMN-binding oxidoreductase [Nocardia mexicana]|uniref:Nitroreductase family protein n=1 Tax=Nocardia mexicana TaxID=279262 RepID=A0A370HE26_9NOCA|nr:nitroreductase family protein [Nocardia mexicana]RDI55295.1 nitroreductase family protein [Nocardia mexicana]